MNNEVSEIQGILIKDAKARKNIEDLNINIEELKDNLDSNKFNIYIPSLKDESTSQSIALVKNKNVAILFDLGDDDSTLNNLQYLSEKLGEQKINYVIVSHYHGDHVTGLEGLSSLFAEDVHFYLPLDFSNYFVSTEEDITTIQTRRTNVLNFLLNNSIDYTEVNSDLELVIDKLTLKLYNSTPQAYAHYKALNVGRYNAYSMVALIKHEDTKILFPGDALKETQDYLISMNQVEKVNITAPFHHGYERIANTEFFNRLNPDIEFFTICPSSWSVIKSQYETDLKTRPTQYLSTTFGEIEFAFDDKGVSIVKGDFLNNNLWKFKSYNLYVDPNYVGVSDGSESKPFISIEQALNYIPFDTIQVTLNLASGVYENTRLLSIPYYLRIEGGENDVTLKGFSTVNSQTIRFSKVKIVDGISCLFGNIYFNNVEFSCSSNGSGYNATTFNHCRAYIANSNFNNCYYGILAEENSNIECEGCTFTNIGLNAVYSISSVVIMTTYTLTSGLFRQANGGRIFTNNIGTTAERPVFNSSNYMKGYEYFDTTLKKPIFYRNNSAGDAWIDATGEEV